MSERLALRAEISPWIAIRRLRKSPMRSPFGVPEDAAGTTGTGVKNEVPACGRLTVAVVATGLGSGAVRIPLQIVDGALKKAPIDPAVEPDYSAFDRPPAMRGAARSAGGAAGAAEAGSAGDDYFDIPAFLRRQAD